MRGQIVLPLGLLLVAGVVLVAIGGHLATWWEVPPLPECTKRAAACADEQAVGRYLALGGAGVLLLVALLNVWLASRRRARRVLRETGRRVSATLVRSKTVGNNEGSKHYKQWWVAHLPEGGEVEFITRTDRWLQNGYVLEAATDGQRATLMLELSRHRIAHDDDALLASHRAALAHRPAAPAVA